MGGVVPRRIRYIKPDRLEDPRFADISVVSRYFYREAVCFMDSQGLTPAEPRLLRNLIFGYDERVRPHHVVQILAELCSIGYYEFYKDEGNQHFIRDVNFLRDQKIHRKESPQYPPVEKLELVDPSLGLAWVEPRSNPLQAALELELELGIGGVGEKGGANTLPPKPKASSPKGAIGELDEFADALDGTTMKLQRAWLERYGLEFVMESIRDALQWEMASPKNNKKDKGKFLNNWLRNNWKRQSSQSQSNSFYQGRS